MANILLVDDEQLVVDTLLSALQSKGHAVVTAANGVEGLRQFERGRFDLVITDIIMPDMEGIGMMREIRRRNPAAKIIAISGGGRTGNADFLNMAAKLGATATLRKPIRLAEFFQVLEACIAKDAEPPVRSRPPAQQLRSLF